MLLIYKHCNFSSLNKTYRRHLKLAVSLIFQRWREKSHNLPRLGSEFGRAEYDTQIILNFSTQSRTCPQPPAASLHGAIPPLGGLHCQKGNHRTFSSTGRMVPFHLPAGQSLLLDPASAPLSAVCFSSSLHFNIHQAKQVMNRGLGWGVTWIFSDRL